MDENRMETLQFRNGDHMPVIGLGTWKSDREKVGNAIKEALHTGYRHVDCAAVYGNEAEIGEALNKVLGEEIERDKLWITSKLWNNAHREEDVIPALKETLSDLQLDYLDLYLIHWPVAFKSGLEGVPESDEDFLSLEQVPLIETWEAMRAAKEQGLVWHLGVSNFSIRKLEELSAETDNIPEMNQVEMHPYLQQDELLDYCREQGIHMTAYSPLGSTDRPEALKGEEEPSLLENEIIQSIATKHNATPAQVLIAWSVKRGTAVIPKSTHAGRIQENLQSMNVELEEHDMRLIQSLDMHFRYVDGSFFETESEMYRNIFDD